MKSRLKRGLFPVLLSILLLLGTMTAFAETATDYGLIVNGIEVTSENAADVLGNGTASVSYDAENDANVLTLNNATLTDAVSMEPLFGRDLVINVLGVNTIDASCISIGERLVLQGGGVLNISTNPVDVRGYGIRAKSVTVDNIELNVKSGGSAIYVEAWNGDSEVLDTDQALNIINGAKVTAVTETQFAVAAVKDVNISNSSLEATSNAAKANALNSWEGKITVDHSVVQAKTTSAESSTTMNAPKGIEVKNESEVTAFGGGSFAISANGTGLTIDNSKVIGEINSSVNRPAIRAANFSIANDSELEARGGISRYKDTPCSLVITPKEGSLADVMAGTNNDGSNAAHFNDSTQSSPYQAVTFTGDTFERLSVMNNKYFHAKPHIHSGGDATCTSQAVCEFCGNAYGDLKEDNHQWGEAGYEWSADGTACTAKRICGYNNAHTESVNATVKGEQTKAPTCTEEGETTNTAEFGVDWASTQTKAFAIKKAEHSYGIEWKSDKENHWHECDCGDKADMASHKSKVVNAKKATTTEKGYTGDTVCEICGYKLAAGKEIPVKTTTTTTTTTTTSNNGKSSSPKTGDNSNITLWVVLMIAAGAGVTGTVVYSQRKRK